MSLPSWTSEAPLVTPGFEQIGPAVERVAVRFVRTWGFSTVGMVAARFRMLTKATAPRELLARRALGVLPDIGWLDPTHEWFSLLERDSPMRASIEKVISTVGTVDRDDLEQALGKRHSFGAAPPAVVRAYVDALAARVSRRGPVRPAALLTPDEHVVLEAFERAGGAAGLVELREATRERLAPAALTRVLQTSPLFLRAGRGSYRVLGAPVWAPVPALGPARQWQAAL